MAVKLIHLPASWQGFPTAKLNAYRYGVGEHGLPRRSSELASGRRRECVTSRHRISCDLPFANYKTRIDLIVLSFPE